MINTRLSTAECIKITSSFSKPQHEYGCLDTLQNYIILKFCQRKHILTYITFKSSSPLFLQIEIEISRKRKSNNGFNFDLLLATYFDLFNMAGKVIRYFTFLYDNSTQKSLQIPRILLILFKLEI